MKKSNDNIVTDFLNEPENIDDLCFVEEINSFAIYLPDLGYTRILKTREVNQKIHAFCRSLQRAGHVLPPIMPTSINAIRQLLELDARSIYSMESDYIAFNDGQVMSLTDFNFYPITRERAALNFFNFSTASLAMPTPTWDYFVRSVFVQDDHKTTDEELVTFAQEMLGYYILNEAGNKFHAVFFWVGEGGNGKGILGQLVEEMFGREFVWHSSLSQLTTDKFEAANLVGKKINISYEEEGKYANSPKFKAMIAGDKLSAARKFESSFDFKPQCKFIFASNNIPNFEDIGYAHKRRIKIIPFKRRFVGKEIDYDILRKLKAELPGILAWAIEGAKRLLVQGSFSNCLVSDLAFNELENSSSSPISFFRSFYEITEEETGQYVSGTDLYNEYKKWCDDTKHMAKSDHNFFKILANESPIGLKTGVTRVGDKMTRVKYCKLIDTTAPHPAEGSTLSTEDVGF